MLDTTEHPPAAQHVVTLAGLTAPLVLPDNPADLLAMPALTAEIAYTPGNALVLISAVETWAKAEASKLDPATTKGRAGLVTIAAKVASTKVGLDGLGLSLTEGWRDRTKVINADRTRIKSALDTLRDAVRQPVTDWEASDLARRQAHEDAVNEIHALAGFMGTPEPASSDLAERLARAQEVGDRDWQEYGERAAKARADTIDRLSSLHAAALAREAERAELDRLRAEAAERKRQDDERLVLEIAAQEDANRAAREAKIAQEAADKARLDAEAETAAAQQRTARVLREAEEALAKAERERLAAADKAARDQQLAIEAERARTAAQKAAEDKAERDRADDKRRRGRVHKAALESLMAVVPGLSEEHGRAVVEAIARNQVPAVSVRY
jgi:hypothetical protein